MLTKTVLKDGNNLVILSTKPNATDPTLTDYQVNFVTLVSGNLRQIGNFSGVCKTIVASYSTKLSKVAVGGLDANNVMFYIVKNIDWANIIVGDIVLPGAVKSSPHFISISDEYLYARTMSDDANG